MSVTVIYPDVSEHQVAINDTFNRQFVMFRDASEWDRPDADEPTNLAWAKQARTSGKIVNFGAYIIPGLVPNDALLNQLDTSGVPNDCVLMVDSESWGGEVTGDHSVQFNTLASELKARQGGRTDLVWGYSNKGDLAIWPNRPSWMGFIIAGYTATQPSVPGLNIIGWQYTNGTQNKTTYPSSTPPFGACDHNVLYVPVPLPGGEDMPLSKADLDAILAELRPVWRADMQAIDTSVARSEGISDVQGKVVAALRGEGVSGVRDELDALTPTLAAQVVSAVTAAGGQLTPEVVEAALKAAFASLGQAA